MLILAANDNFVFVGSPELSAIKCLFLCRSVWALILQRFNWNVKKAQIEINAIHIVLWMIKWNLKRLVYSCFIATAGFMMQSVQAGEKIGADQLRIHLYVVGILNRLKVNSSDGLQMRKGYVSLFSPLKLTDADLQSVRVRPWVKKKFSCKWRTQLLFTVWMASLTRHSICSSMPRISIMSKSAAEFARRPGFPITLINGFSIDQTVRKPTEQMRFIRMCPLACFE